MFEPMISAPALPKTVDRRAPILIIALLMMVVSNYIFVFSSYLAADSGSLAMSMSFSIIPSMGYTSKVSMSLEKRFIMISKVIQVKRVFAIWKAATIRLYLFWLRIAVNEFRSVVFECLRVNPDLRFIISLELMI